MADIALWPTVDSTQYEQPIVSGVTAGSTVTGYEEQAQCVLIRLLNTKGAVSPNRKKNNSAFIDTLREAGTTNEWLVKAAFDACVRDAINSVASDFSESAYQPSEATLDSTTAQSDHFDMDVTITFTDGTTVTKTVSVFV